MTDYYIFTRKGAHAPSDRLPHLPLDGGIWCVVTNPREILLSEEADDIYLPAMLAADEYRVARLEPLGPVREDDCELFECETGWTVAAVEPLDCVLGPQAVHLRAAITLAEGVLTGEDNPAAAHRYIEALNAQYPDGVTRIGQPAADGAKDALDAIAADGWLWAEAGFSCAYGQEMLALAARDLIGTTPEWTWQAYGLLTAPWREAFGQPVHPDDAAVEALAG
jgi:hypothetical protein